MAAEIDIVNIDFERFTTEYVVSFFDDEIHTIVTADGDKVTQWFNELEPPNIPLAGVGVHFRHLNEHVVATLDLCVGGRCLIYQLDWVTTSVFPHALLEFIANEDYTFIGWNTSHCLKYLRLHQALGIPKAIAVDVRPLTAERLSDCRLDHAELSELAKLVLDKEVKDVPTEVGLMRWDLRWLTSEQVKHACVEAFVCFEIGRVLNAREFRLAYRDDHDYSDYRFPDSPDSQS